MAARFVPRRVDSFARSRRLWGSSASPHRPHAIVSKNLLSCDSFDAHGRMSSEQQKPLMNESASIRAAVEGNDRAAASWLTLVGFAFLTFNSAMAVYQSNGGMGAAAFVAFSLLDLVLLFYCLRLYNQAAPRSLRREHLKMAMWLLIAMLTISAFMLMEFWFSNTEVSGAKRGIAPQQQQQIP